MPFNWTPEAQQKMLLLVIKENDVSPKPEVFEAVATILGGGVNANACSQKYYKLKREADKILNENGGIGNGSTANPSTPTNKTAPKTPRKKKTGDDDTTGKGHKRDAGELDEADGNATPSKSNGTAKKGRARKVAKTEPEHDEKSVIKTENGVTSHDPVDAEANGDHTTTDDMEDGQDIEG